MFLALGGLSITNAIMASSPVLLVTQEHRGPPSPPRPSPMSIWFVDKQLASGPPAPAKCDFKVGHVNERDRFTTTGLGTLLSAEGGGLEIVAMVVGSLRWADH